MLCNTASCSSFGTVHESFHPNCMLFQSFYFLSILLLASTKLPILTTKIRAHHSSILGCITPLAAISVRMVTNIKLKNSKHFLQVKNTEQITEFMNPPKLGPQTIATLSLFAPFSLFSSPSFFTALILLSCLSLSSSQTETSLCSRKDSTRLKVIQNRREG